MVRRSAARWITFLVLLAHVLTVGALMVSWASSSSAIAEEHTVALLESSAGDTAVQAELYLSPAESTVTFGSSILADGNVAPKEIRGAILDSLDEHPQLAGVFVGESDGSFYFVSRTEDGFRVKNITVNNKGRRKVALDYLDADQQLVASEVDPEDSYDPRTRPWYSQAINGGGEVIWTDPYVFFTSQQLGITAASPIVVDGEVVGVVGADMELGALSDFLAEDVATDGSSLIVNETGVVLAHSDRSLVQSTTPEGPETMQINDLPAGQGRNAMAAWLESGSDSASTSFEVDGAKHFGAFRTTSVASKNFVIGVFGDQEAVSSDVRDTQRRERKLQFSVGGIALLVAGLLLMRVARPIKDLQAEATTDALTGLPNRRSILGVAAQLDDRDTPHALAMIDLDNFKTINDTHGHSVGDEVLQAVADRLRSALRTTDFVGRVGGEEFVAVLHDVGPEQAADLVARLWKAVRISPIKTSIGEIVVTASFGVATAVGASNHTDLLAEADRALLEAKASGRDQVLVLDLAGELLVQ